LGIAKLAVEKYGLMFQRLMGLPVIMVRPANAYSEGQLPFRGQGFVTAAVASIIQKRPITVYGDDAIVRDYVYVEDVAADIVAARESGRIGNCYNVGAGVSPSTNRVLAMISDLARGAGLEVEMIDKPARPFHVFANGLDRVWRWARHSPEK
jgi:UDP-glucose 4-epimerase